MFEQVYPLLSQFHARHLQKNDWRNIFNVPWEAPYNLSGFALVDNAKIVGFIGAIFSFREMNKQRVSVCNITSWIVEKKYRKESLSLLYPILALEAHIILNLSPSKTVYEILMGFGFKPLDTCRYILFPLFTWSAMKSKKHLSVITHHQEIRGTISQPERAYLNDHIDYKCIHIIFKQGEEYCYLIFSLTKVMHLPFCYILYCSNPAFFVAHSAYITFYLLTRNRRLFMIIDPRILNNLKPKMCIIHKRLHPSLYKTAHGMLPPNDNLYTEDPILNHA
ncbi:MAG: hypothetical protein ABII23_08950 [bacterium]